MTRLERWGMLFWLALMLTTVGCADDSSSFGLTFASCGPNDGVAISIGPDSHASCNIGAIHDEGYGKEEERGGGVLWAVTLAFGVGWSLLTVLGNYLELPRAAGRPAARRRI